MEIMHAVFAVALMFFFHVTKAEETYFETGLPDEVALSLSREMTKRSMEERAVTCDCSGSSCSCCADINFNSFGFDIDDRGCLSVSTDDDMYTVTLKLGSKTLYTETLPFGTLPTPCLKFGAARICLEFYDVNWDLADFGGCARAKVKFLGFTVSKLKLGCFDF